MDHKEYVLDYIETIDDTLDFAYGTPDHNNKKYPLDEMVFILLSRRTRNTGYESVFDDLKERYRTWENVLSNSVIIFSNLFDLFFIISLSRN